MVRRSTLGTTSGIVDCECLHVGDHSDRTDQVHRKQVTDQEIQSLHEFASSQGSKLTSYITSLRQDVTFLSKLGVIHQHLRAANAEKSSDGSPDTADDASSIKSEIDSIFMNYLSQKYDYMQMRILDKEGEEIIRVERSAPGGRPKIGNLSFKGDRPYFSDSIKLADGQWYLSPIELNVENGQKQPELPVVRAAVPIFLDDQSEPSGIVIINTHFREIVKSLGNFDSHHSQGVIYLTNREGQFLYHPESDLSFAFERNLDYRIQDLYEELLPEFQGSSSSILRTKRTGMISQATEVRPAVWIRTQLRPYQVFSTKDKTFESIHESFRNVLTSAKSDYAGLECKIGNEGEAIIFGISETELDSLAHHLESTLGYPIDIEKLPDMHRSKSHAIHLNFLPLQLGNDDQALGLVLALPSDAFASHSGTGKSIFWIALALLLAVVVITLFLTARQRSRSGAL